MNSSFYSPSGARRGLIIALGAICMWMGCGLVDDA